MGQLQNHQKLNQILKSFWVKFKYWQNLPLLKHTLIFLDVGINLFGHPYLMLNDKLREQDII